ncbi:hypothetical protein B0H34DRAFT_810383 [Crassisporium funariophilum]|nr:hypothetical protein B0H34DRAFT_810383 [Crassisporium funariophilum]
MPQSSTCSSTCSSSCLAMDNTAKENESLTARTGNGKKAAHNSQKSKAPSQACLTSMAAHSRSDTPSSELPNKLHLSNVTELQTNTNTLNSATQDDASSRSKRRLSNSTNVPVHCPQDIDQTDAMDELRLERDRLRGRRIKLQHNMGLDNDRMYFLSIRCTIKDTVKHAGLNYMVCWEQQPKDKLAKILWVAKDRQPYLKHFAHNWPIEEYIKQHHKNLCHASRSQHAATVYTGWPLRSRRQLYIYMSPFIKLLAHNQLSVDLNVGVPYP